MPKAAWSPPQAKVYYVRDGDRAIYRGPENAAPYAKEILTADGWEEYSALMHNGANFIFETTTVSEFDARRLAGDLGLPRTGWR